MKTIVAIWVWSLFAIQIAMMVWSFLHVLKTGNLRRVVVINWIAIVCLMGLGMYVGISVRGDGLSAELSDGPDVLAAIIMGWGHGLIPGGIAKILFVRRKSIAENSKHTSQQ